MLPEVEQDVRARAHKHFYPRRRALSLRFPALAPTVITAHRTLGDLRRLSAKPARFITTTLPYSVYKHSSLLRRRLGASDPRLQEGKIRNLEIAVRKLNGVTIRPSEEFSFWRLLGSTTEAKGYVPGMLLTSGKVVEGIGGGLCQLSNLLYWMFLHSPLTITERHHHSFDPFPDNGRTLPFGSGATIMDRILDLRARNKTSAAFQIRLWLTDTHLCGALLSDRHGAEKFHVVERYPYFVCIGGMVFRYNQIYRETRVAGEIVREEHIATNFAPVLYDTAGKDVVDLGTA